jgi:hypothetical protein
MLLNSDQVAKELSLMLAKAPTITNTHEQTYNDLINISQADVSTRVGSKTADLTIGPSIIY